nr:hypothetical protein BaRGS_023877 [Batillaria attramentaria]
MTGHYGVLCFIAMATLFFGSCNATDLDYAVPENMRFSGGSMSFEFVEAKYDDDIYKVRVTLITSWVLGKGPCGPGCGPDDVGTTTHDRRLQIIANTHDPVIFGNWSTERKRSVISHAEFQDITDTVTQNIQGRVASVSTRLNFEQEIAHFDLDIDKGYSYTDIVSYWVFLACDGFLHYCF